jgi:hypothetical protein
MECSNGAAVAGGKLDENTLARTRPALDRNILLTLLRGDATFVGYIAD